MLLQSVGSESKASGCRIKKERRKRRGAADRPAQDAQTLDDVEHRIIERIEAHKQDAHKLYLEHLQTYDDRLAALDFEGRFSVIQQAAPEAVGDFRAEAALIDPA